MSAHSSITRRALVGMAASVTASAAQEQPAQPPTPEQDLNARRSQMKANFEQMSKTPLSMFIEPAVTFRA